MSDERVTSEQTNDPELQAILSWPSSRSFDLEVVSWLQKHHGASHGGGRTDFSHLDDLEVQVCCQQVRHWRGDKATVGENPRQNLDDLRFTLKLTSAERVFARLETVPSARDHDTWQGYLEYSKPAVYGDIWLGAETIREIARVLAFRPGQKVRICLTVKAMREPTKGAMTFEDPDFNTRTYHWSYETADDWLYITDAVAIIENAPISEETEADEDGRLLLKPLWPSLVGILVGNLFIAWLVYKAAMQMHVGSTDAFTWNVGPLGAGSLGAGSVSALWIGFLAFMLFQWISGACVWLGQMTVDMRKIRESLSEFTTGRRRKRA